MLTKVLAKLQRSESQITFVCERASLEVLIVLQLNKVNSLQLMSDFKLSYLQKVGVYYFVQAIPHPKKWGHPPPPDLHQCVFSFISREII